MALEIKLRSGSSVLTNYISWTRLERQLKKVGELRPGESIQRLIVDEKGIQYFIKTD